MSNPNADRTRLGPFRKKHIVAAGVFLLAMLLLTLVAQNIYYYITPKVVVSRPQNGVIEKSINLHMTRAEGKSDEAFFALKLPSGLSLYVSDLLVTPGKAVSIGTKLVRFNDKSVQDVRDAYAAALANAEKQLDFYAGEAEKLAFTHRNALDAVNRDITALTGKTYATASDEQSVKSIETGIKTTETALAKAQEERANLAILVDAGIEPPSKLTQQDRSIAEQEAALAEKHAELSDAQARAAASYTDAMAALTRKRSELVRDYEFNISRLTYSGKTLTELEADVAAAEADIASFDSVITEDNCYLSPCEGTLERYFIERASMFSGMERVASFTGTRASVLYEATLAKDDELLTAGKQLTVNVLGKRIPVTIESKEKVGAGAHIVLVIDTKTLENAEISPETTALDAVLLVASERYEVIVPNAAIAYDNNGACVYMLSEQEGYFGTQNYIVAVPAEPIESGGGYVALQISGYFNNSTRIVVSWDRALQNLGKVIVVAEQ